MSKQVEQAVLAGGCFWCLEAVYERIPGVLSVVSGYTGGSVAHPTYEQVCTGTTGHAEAVRIEYDAEKVSYEEILRYFFKYHDPTTLNRQGADVGTQYRSAIFCENDAQESAARAAIVALEHSGAFKRKIVTEVRRLDTFYPAEEYHQRYFARNPHAGYCRIVVRPKVEKVVTELGGQ